MVWGDDFALLAWNGALFSVRPCCCSLHTKHPYTLPPTNADESSQEHNGLNSRTVDCRVVVQDYSLWCCDTSVDCIHVWVVHRTVGVRTVRQYVWNVGHLTSRNIPTMLLEVGPSDYCRARCVALCSECRSIRR